MITADSNFSGELDALICCKLSVVDGVVTIVPDGEHDYVVHREERDGYEPILFLTCEQKADAGK
jgi:hypothetical protein